MKKALLPAILATFLLVGCTSFFERDLRGNTFTISIQSGGTVSQESITINQGDTIKWVNKDSEPHKIKSELFESPTLNPNEKFEYTFEQPVNLTYTYTTGTASITVN